MTDDQESTIKSTSSQPGQRPDSNLLDYNEKIALAEFIEKVSEKNLKSIIDDQKTMIYIISGLTKILSHLSFMGFGKMPDGNDQEPKF